MQTCLMVHPLAESAVAPVLIVSTRVHLRLKYAVSSYPVHDATLFNAIAQVPAGHWGVAVSGGADSVALLRLLHRRNDLQLRILHLDHETRAGASTTDAEFVMALGEVLNIPSSIARRSAIELGMKRRPNNLSARYRAVRYAFFKHVVAEHALDGVILAHHADDQTETVLLRVLRNASTGGLAGMMLDTRVADVRIVRPLLNVRRDRLRAYLRGIHQDWREDVTNSLDISMRNRLRNELANVCSRGNSVTRAADVDHVGEHLHRAVIAFSEACRSLEHYLTQATPPTPEDLRAGDLTNLPDPLARRMARDWLGKMGVPRDHLSPDVSDRLLHMARDHASSPVADFPGRIRVHRSGGSLRATRVAKPSGNSS